MARPSFLRAALAVAAFGASVAACNGSGSATSGGGASASVGKPVACSSEAAHMGDGTYYAADGTGNCGFDKSADLMVGAMNHTDYAASAVCGECVAIAGPKGAVTIAIVDQCPECKPGDIDLSQEAFAKIADVSAGRVSISWKVVSCGLPGPIAYHEKDGSNAYWTAVQIRNSNNAILKLEAMKNGAYETLPRVDYNYFIDDKGLGNGPFDFRVTDIYGNVLEDKAIPLGANQTFQGAAQFPPCP